MATVRPSLRHLRRVELSWIGLWLAGALCGVLLMLGYSTLHHASSTAIAPPVSVTAPVGVPGVAGGRAGGITSSDTATDAQIRQGVSTQPAVSGDLDLPRMDEVTYYRNASSSEPPPFEVHNGGPQ